MKSGFLSPFLSLFADAGHYLVCRRMADAIPLPIGVVSVGNITFGGTAKTPMAEHLARLLLHRGHRPGIVMRGYGGRIERKSGEPELVSDGIRVRLGWEDGGDEAGLLAGNLLDLAVPVAVGRDRIAASKLLIESCSVDVLILDDGFQFTRLARDVDIVLVDAMAPLGRYDGGVGLLREPLSSLDRADAIVLTRSDAVDRDRVDWVKRRLSGLLGGRPLFTARTVVKEIRRLDGGVKEDGRRFEGARICAFAGIGNPLSFKATLMGLGCDVAELMEFPDHHPYRERDLVRLDKRAGELGAELILTTAKDAIRLDGAVDAMAHPVYIVDIELAVDGEDAFAELVESGIAEKTRGKPDMPDMSPVSIAPH